MQKINSAKIQFAAHFIANQLDIYFLESSHGEHSKLFIKFVSKRITKDSDINQWMNQEGRIYPRWESKNNPWEVLSYIGPVKNQQEDSLYSSIIAVSNKKEKASHVIQKTLNLYRLCDLGIKERSALQSILNICLEEAQLNCFTDGINNRSSENILTLSSAQHLADKVRNSDQITTNDLELIKVLLTKAPLEFGFWGPFKTLLKFLSPTILPKEFGKALGRLSRDHVIKESKQIEIQKTTFFQEEKDTKKSTSNSFNPTDWGFWSQKFQAKEQDKKERLPYEDISWLREIIAIPSPQTICYLCKRMRRVLQKVGKEDPKSYAIIASHTLIEWDSFLNRHSFIPAFILGGRNKILNKKSRSVKIPLKQDQRCEPYPEAWNQNIELIKEVLSSTKTSHEIITFCIQILRENGTPLKELEDQSKRHFLLVKKAEEVLQGIKRKEEKNKIISNNPTFLGKTVSNRLNFSEETIIRLSNSELPVISSFEELASLLRINTTQLKWLTFSREKVTTDHYNRFKIPKRSGGERFISSPKPKLRKAQKWVLKTILNKIPINSVAMAFRPKLSIVDNAQFHIDSKIVIRIDLKDFFSSITFHRIRGLFESTGYNQGVATVLALLCSDTNKEIIVEGSTKYYLSKGSRSLPQGACTSPALANIISRNLDNRLRKYSEKAGWIYSRYADDLIFSTKEESASAHRLIRAVEMIIDNEGFKVNTNKTRIMRSPSRQTVTGLLVNNEVRLSKKDLRRLRAFLHRCSKKGIEAVSQDIGKDAKSVAKGNIAYVQMVSPSIAEKILKKNQWINN